MKKFLALILFCLPAFAQTPPPPTNTAQFTANFNFLGVAPYGQSQALSLAGTSQFTTNSLLRMDVITMPSIGYTGYFVGPQYNLCGVKAIENLLSPTSFNCGKFEPYVNGGAGIGRLQQNSDPTTHGAAFIFRTGVNLTMTNTVGFNLYEVGCGDFGPKIPGQSHVGCFGQTGINFYLGSNQVATAAKRARANRSNVKRLAKLNKIASEK